VIFTGASSREENKMSAAKIEQKQNNEVLEITIQARATRFFENETLLVDQ
jgi:hypothetical protein